jgi:hypothetical protein
MAVTFLNPSRNDLETMPPLTGLEMVEVLAATKMSHLRCLGFCIGVKLRFVRTAGVGLYNGVSFYVPRAHAFINSRSKIQSPRSGEQVRAGE